MNTISPSAGLSTSCSNGQCRVSCGGEQLCSGSCSSVSSSCSNGLCRLTCGGGGSLTTSPGAGDNEGDSGAETGTPGGGGGNNNNNGGGSSGNTGQAPASGGAGSSAGTGAGAGDDSSSGDCSQVACKRGKRRESFTCRRQSLFSCLRTVHIQEEWSVESVLWRRGQVLRAEVQVTQVEVQTGPVHHHLHRGVRKRKWKQQQQQQQ